MKIKYKMLLSFGGLLLIILTSLGIVLYRTTENRINLMIEDELEQVTDLTFELVKSAVDNTIKSHLRATAEKSKNIVEYYYKRYKEGELSESQAYAEVKSILLDPDFGRIGKTGYLAGVDGNGILVIHPKSAGADASSFDFMKKAVKIKNGYLEYMWKNVGESKERAKAGGLAYFEPWDLIVWASSYKNEFNELLNLDDLKESVYPIHFGQTGAPFILDSNGAFLIHRELEGVEGQNLQDGDGQYFVREILNKKEGSIAYSWKDEGGKHLRKKLAYFKQFPQMNWIVAVEAYPDEFYGPIYNIRNILIGAIVITFILMSILILVILSKLLKPLKKIEYIVGSISSGDLTETVEVHSKDEIGNLSLHFNTLLSGFKDLIRRVRESTTVLSESIQNLSTSAKEISTTSNQQAAAVKEILSTMEDSDSLSKSNAQKINEVTTVSNSMKADVEKGYDHIKSNIEKMDEIKNTNGETIEGMKSLGEQIQSIWEVVNIINGIADQTKIIAFNAELEASKAGEAGKNFQIVANEIRRLADNTVSSTAEIRSNINEIQRASDSLILASEDGTEKIKEGWELSNNLKEIFDTILSSSEVSAASAGQISVSINQQVSSFGQILLTLMQISEGIDNFVESTRATTSASENLRDITEGLQTIVDKYKLEKNYDQDTPDNK